MSQTILVGGYTDTITSLSFNPDAQPPTIEIVGTAPAGSNPTWIERHPKDKTLVIALNEPAEGKLFLYKVKEDRTLDLLQTAWSGGGGTTYLYVGEDEVICANYYSGAIATFPLDVATQKILPAVHEPLKFEFPGVGTNPSRQEGSHPHQVVPDGSGSRLFIPDLGSDKVWIVDRKSKDAPWTTSGAITMSRGQGTRHLALDGETVYVVSELASRLTAYSYIKSDLSAIREIASLATVTPPDETTKDMLAGGILLSKSTATYPEQFIYVANRNQGHPEGDSIAIFTPVNSPIGFALVNEIRTGLKHPRGFAFGGDENKYIIAAGQNGGGVKVFERIEGGRSLKELVQLESEEVRNPTSVLML